MAKTKTSWSAGTSGNPKGRPRKNRSLTELLRKAGERMVYDDYGNLRPANETLANLIWSLMVRGQVSLSGNVYGMHSLDEWLDAVKWMYKHVDGSAELEATINKVTRARSGTEGGTEGDAEGDAAGGETGYKTDGEPTDDTADETEAERLASQRLSAEQPEEARIEISPLEELKHLVYVPEGLDEGELYNRERRRRLRQMRS